jgi:hypothetical protein
MRTWKRGITRQLEFRINPNIQNTSSSPYRTTRIVAKVDELMALCDQLEFQLADTAVDSCRLLEAVLHEALLSAGQTV